MRAQGDDSDTTFACDYERVQSSSSKPLTMTFKAENLGKPLRVHICAIMDDFTTLKRKEDWAIPDAPSVEFKLDEEQQLRCLQRGIRQVEMVIYCFRHSEFHTDNPKRISMKV